MAEANRAGIFTDIDSLANRRGIELAAFFGNTATKYGYEQRGEDSIKSGYTKERNGTYTKMVDQIKNGFVSVNGNYYSTASRRDAVTGSGQIKSGFAQNADGQYYRTNKTYNANQAVAKVKQVADRSEATTPNSYWVRLYDENGKKLKEPERVSEKEAVADFTGKGTLDASQVTADWQKKQMQANAQFGLDLADRYGEEYVALSRETSRKLDPEGFAAREKLGDLAHTEFLTSQGLSPNLLNYSLGRQQELVGMQDRPQMELFGQRSQMEKFREGPAQERFYDNSKKEQFQNYLSYERMRDEGPTGPSFKRGKIEDDGGFAKGSRSALESQLLSELLGEGQLSEREKNQLEQDVRAAQVARGNYGGSSAEVQEAFAKSTAVDKRKRENRAELQNYLSSGQTTLDLQNLFRREDNTLSQQEFGNKNQQFDNKLTALEQRNRAGQAEFDNAFQAMQQRNEATQADSDNALRAIAQRNAAAATDEDSRFRAAQQRNAAQQADLDNEFSFTNQRNQAKQADFSNLLNTINQRNQAAQVDQASLDNYVSNQNAVEMQDFQNNLSEINSINSARQQQISNLGSFVSGAPFGQIAAANVGAQALPVPMQGTNLLNLIGLNPNAGQQGADFALGVFGNQSANYRAGLDYSSNMYRTNQAYNSPMSWLNTIGGLNPFSFNMGGV